ncbi:MAG: hypothetical protein D4S02_10880, partial [Rhodocyclaceae bacterium]
MRWSGFLIAVAAGGLFAQVFAQSPEAAQDSKASAAMPADQPPDAAALMREGRYAEALIELERQVMVEPRNAGASPDFCLLHYSLGLLEESQAVFVSIYR